MAQRKVWRRRSRNLDGLKRTWFREPPPAMEQRCYRRKTDALNALRSYNQRMIDVHLIDAGSEDWDAVEAQYGGKVRDVHAAMAKAFRGRGAPYCVTDFDLDTFRETTAVQMAEDRGAAFQLPGAAHEYTATREEERAGIEAGLVDQCFTIKRPRRRVRGRFRPPQKRRTCVCRDDSGRFESCAVRQPELPFYDDEVPF